MKKNIWIILLFALRVSAQNQPITTQEISIDSELNGTLYNASNDLKKPTLAILIAGSGPTNRSGNQPNIHNNSLKYLAEGLATKGINVFCFDKRVIARIIAGKTDDFNMLFEDNSTDVNLIVSYFKELNKYSKIVLIGHSEGSLIGMMSATKNVDGFVSIAGAGRSIDLIMKDQISKNYPYIIKEFEEKLDLLKKGESFVLTSENTILATLLNKKNRPYLKSWIDINPQEKIKKLHIPILLINGTKDLQVPESEAILLKEVQPNAELIIINNMNHVLKIIDGDEVENKASYNNPKLPIATELVTSIYDFIAKM